MQLKKKEREAHKMSLKLTDAYLCCLPITFVQLRPSSDRRMTPRVKLFDTLVELQKAFFGKVHF